MKIDYDELVQEVYAHKAMINVLIQEIIKLKGFNTEKEVNNFISEFKLYVANKIKLIEEASHNQ